MHTSRIRGCINVRRKRVKGLSLHVPVFLSVIWAPVHTLVFFSPTCGELRVACCGFADPEPTPHSRVCGGRVFWALESGNDWSSLKNNRGEPQAQRSMCFPPQTAKKKQGLILLYAVKTTKKGTGQTLAGLRFARRLLGAFLRAAPPKALQWLGLPPVDWLQPTRAVRVCAPEERPAVCDVRIPRSVFLRGER